MRNQRIEHIKDLLDGLQKTRWGLENIIKLEANIKGTQTLLNSIYKKEDSLNKELTKIRKECKHDFEYGGSGHKDSWYVCRDCGEMEDR